MGIFDGYQFEDSPQGGIIGRLIEQLSAQNQYQPSQGFGQNPMDANAAAPEQASPIGVGGYQMPRLGDASLYQSSPAAIPQTAQPAQYNPQPQQPQAPSFLQQPQSSPLATSFQSWANTPVGNPMAALANGISSLSSGRRTDPTGIANDQMAAQFQSYKQVFGGDEKKATLALLNPALGQKMVEHALAGKQYAFTTSPDGTVIRTDAHAGTAEPVYQGGLKPTFGVINEDDGKKTYGWLDPGKRTATPYQPSGAEERDKGVVGPDGKIIPYPEGVDRKTFRNEISKINADAAGGKKTEVQAKDEKFANKMENAEKNLKGLDDQYTGIAGGVMRGTEYLPGGNAVQSGSYQKYKQARDNFLTALLRDESGAAIGTSEFNRYEKELFPQPGDAAGVIEQKREARRIAIEGMKKGAGPGYKSPNYGGTSETKADPLGIR